MTGEWSYGIGGGLVSPAVAVNPSPIIGYPGAAVFPPSPIFAAPQLAPAKKKDETKKDDKKDDKKKLGRGWWETMYDDHGNRYWKHTVSEKTTYRDPYY